MKEKIQFNKNFIWGAATSSYQIEGAINEDGKGVSNWDMFALPKNRKIADGSTGKTTADHYHHLHEDILHMEALNLKAYRFSVS